jgi:hypothetical protein
MRGTEVGDDESRLAGYLMRTKYVVFSAKCKAFRSRPACFRRRRELRSSRSYHAHESLVRSVPKRSKTPWREHFFDKSTELLKMVKVVAASTHANAQPAENKAERIIGSVERVEHVPNLSLAQAQPLRKHVGRSLGGPKFRKTVRAPPRSRASVP